MLSQTVEYALRAIAYLAGQENRSCPNDEIAAATKVPAAYLSKVLQSLNRAGLVHSQRGVRGGFTLAKPADKLTILAVVNAVEPIQRIRTCPLKLKSHGVRLCPLHKRLDDALAMVEKAFANTTLAEVLAEPSDSIPLCDFPATTATRLGLPLIRSASASAVLARPDRQSVLQAATESCYSPPPKLRTKNAASNHSEAHL